MKKQVIMSLDEYQQIQDQIEDLQDEINIFKEIVDNLVWKELNIDELDSVSIKNILLKR